MRLNNYYFTLGLHVSIQTDQLQFMVGTQEAFPVCSLLSTRERPTTLVPRMDAVMDSCGVPLHLISTKTRNIPSVPKNTVSGQCY